MVEKYRVIKHLVRRDLLGSRPRHDIHCAGGDVIEPVITTTITTDYEEPGRNHPPLFTCSVANPAIWL